ncbi:hypothetical protein ACHAXT_001339 [Thalassiosira profunda]
MSAADRDVLTSQLASLDATDAYASAWEAALAEASAATASGDAIKVSWGGRGKGGRGAARRTFQPHDIVVEDVSLEYVNDASVTGEGSGGSKVLLQGAYLKLLPGKVYTLIGRNGVGKSSLLKRIDACKIPGFPPHITTLLVPQEVFGHADRTPLDIVLQHKTTMMKKTQDANQFSIAELEDEMDALDTDADDYQEKMEDICNRIAELEDAGCDGEDDNREEQASDALRFFGVPDSCFDTPTDQLSGGVRKKVALACALMEKPQLLLLDEPTCHIDVGGILQLRQLIADCVASNATVVLVSHDVDLMNDVGTDVIDFLDGQLGYYTGNYRNYLKYREENLTHQIKQAGALEKQRTSMVQTIDHLKKKSSQAGNRTTKKKINKQLKSKEKKLERHGIEKNEHGHRRTAQTDGGIRKGSINAIGASQRNAMTHKQLLKLAEVSVGPIPDKAVQFDFENTTCTWGDEPLVSIMDVGRGYSEEPSDAPSNLIFDCVDLSIREGSRTTILGENGSGKSTLLSIVAGEMAPSIGTVHFAAGVTIGYFHQHSADDLVRDAGRSANGGLVTPLSYLTERFPSKTEQDIRGALTSFGLSPQQAATNVRFLSGGERCRLCMTSMMLEAPELLVIDEISNHLDVESVEALIYGIRAWNGTVVMASHDANLIRSVGGDAFVLFDGKLQRVKGIDSYLSIFARHYHKAKP